MIMWAFETCANSPNRNIRSYCNRCEVFRSTISFGMQQRHVEATLPSHATAECLAWGETSCSDLSEHVNKISIDDPSLYNQLDFFFFRFLFVQFSGLFTWMRCLCPHWCQPKYLTTPMFRVPHSLEILCHFIALDSIGRNEERETKMHEKWKLWNFVIDTDTAKRKIKDWTIKEYPSRAVTKLKRSF